jgi:hypothetical protein
MAGSVKESAAKRLTAVTPTGAAPIQERLLLSGPARRGNIMGATIALVLLLGFVLGGMVLMLTAGYLAAEEERAKEGTVRRAGAVRATEVFATPGFFAGLDASKAPPASLLAFDDTLLAQLESHVRAEQVIATQFVHYPSVDSLYRQRGPELRVH